jgi:hypothetical protein
VIGAPPSTAAALAHRRRTVALRKLYEECVASRQRLFTASDES